MIRCTGPGADYVAGRLLPLLLPAHLQARLSRLEIVVLRPGETPWDVAPSIDPRIVDDGTPGATARAYGTYSAVERVIALRTVHPGVLAHEIGHALDHLAGGWGGVFWSDLASSPFQRAAREGGRLLDACVTSRYSQHNAAEMFAEYVRCYLGFGMPAGAGDLFDLLPGFTQPVDLDQADDAYRLVHGLFTGEAFARTSAPGLTAHVNGGSYAHA